MIRKILIADLFIVMLMVFNLLALFQQPILVQNIYNSFFTLVVPGFLIYASIRRNLFSLTETIVYSIVLSIAFQYLIGLLLTFAFVSLNFKNPLDTFSLLIGTNIAMIILGVTAVIRTNWFAFTLSFPPVNPAKVAIAFFPIIFVLMSIGGAIRLNNGASNDWTMVMLVLMAVYIVTIALVFRNRHFHYGLPIYLISVSLILMLSLRSEYVSGWDIQEEYVKFAQTLAQNQWSTAIDRSAYNTCLSITMLPAMIHRLTNIPPEYIFKVLFQLVFALMPVSIYLLTRQYTDRSIAFLSVVYMLAQPFFIQPMTSIIRQEIAFLFFTVILFTLFNKGLSYVHQRIILFTCVIGLVLSHYSTAYLAIVLFSLTFGFFFIYRMLLRIERVREFFRKIKLHEGDIYQFPHMITIPFLIILISSTLLWYTVINKSDDNLYTIAVETIENFADTFKANPKSSDANATFTLFSKKGNDTVSLIEQYIEERKGFYESYYMHHYHPDTYRDFKIIVHEPKTVKPVFDSFLNSKVLLFFELIKQLAKVLLIVGGIYILIFLWRKQETNKEYLLIGYVSLLFIVIILFHPTLSIRYNISRTYLQLLSVLSLFAVFGCFAFTFSFKRGLQLGITSVLFSFLFLYNHGFVNQISGGQAYMHLNNYGEDYEKFFVHDTEMTAGTWLKDFSDPVPPVFADGESYLRLYKTGNKYALPAILPQFIQKRAYVYARDANVLDGRTVLNYNGRALLYKYPLTFLNKNKNLIYSNNSTLIYR